MATIDFKKELGLERAIHISETGGMATRQVAVMEEVKSFGIDEVYFSADEKTCYPAIFLKKVETFEITTLKEIASIQQNLWNYQKVLFLYVYNEIEIRIYNCSEKPVAIHENADVEEELAKLEIARAKDREALENVIKIFSSAAIDTGIIWTLPEAYEIKKKINLQKRVDKYLVNSLVKTAIKLKKTGLADITIIHKIILRSLFLLYLEDRGATDAGFYNTIKRGAKSYFDILDDVDSTYKLYAELETHFNGNVFSVTENEKCLLTKKHLQLIKSCFLHGLDNNGESSLFGNWRLFNFKIIRIELLSEIYEHFLAEEDRVGKKQSGAFYTPPSLVELILNDKLPAGKQYTNYNVKILDPACGSGIFLVESYKRLVERYENKTGKKLTNFQQLTRLLVDNIFGIEINDRSIVVAAFSLYLALLDHLDPKTLWQFKKLPYLINDPKNIPTHKQGNNLFCRDAIETNDEIENIRFDLVVGNPPFGTENKSGGIALSPVIREYCHNENFAKEMVLPFMHKAVKYAPQGEIALIFHTKILTNTGSTYQNFRRWLFNDCYVEKIYNFSILRKAPKNFGGQLFGSATGPICIAFYKKEEPAVKSDRIIYYAPQTYIKSNVIEGLVIDSTDVKYLPREECQKPGSRIWKIAMWGGEMDFSLIRKLTSRYYGSINSFIKKKNIKSGVGFQLLTNTTDKPRSSKTLSVMPYLDADRITRYVSFNQTSNITKSIKTKKAIDFYTALYQVKSVSDIERLSCFRRLGNLEAYKAPHMVIKKGLEDNQICASYLEEDCCFRDGVYGFYGTDENALKFLLAYLNSKLSTYYLFMTISSYGIEREQIMKNEYLSVPIPKASEVLEKKILPVINDYLKKVKEANHLESKDFNQEKITIDKLIGKSLDLDQKEINLINDCVDINIDLFHNQEKSRSLLPVCDFTVYAETVCAELNDFLEDEKVYANATVYPIRRDTPLAILKISFDKTRHEIRESSLSVNKELKKINQWLWEKKGGSIYFRKKLNYYSGDDIYIIRLNQHRFWTKTRAMEDASELILEILNEG